MVKPEDHARERIDEALAEAGWAVQNAKAAGILAARGVAIFELLRKHGHRSADYVLDVDGNAVGLVEAKKEAESLTGVELQSEEYAPDLRNIVPARSSRIVLLARLTGTARRSDLEAIGFRSSPQVTRPLRRHDQTKDRS